ncbi:DUF2520 domain-containing protein [Fervidobacterium thailandense]|uniref:DUF2520 domain-containing protein n=1 Tax=Fervidobacterium thailandense TaxID=1008305 RepID=A0A1E3G1T7_9BACT|nr:DUF2520 domain-containing protein [Fervidobacterium thailandense]ODN30110.1 hypothetical protein A4H02_07350 [Fervidobacterium thailandense]
MHELTYSTSDEFSLDSLLFHVVGVGKVSSSFARNLARKCPLVRFGYVVSRDIDKSRSLAHELGAEPKSYNDEFVLEGVVLFGYSDSVLVDAPKIVGEKIGSDVIAVHFSGFHPSTIFPKSWNPVSIHPNCAVASYDFDFTRKVFGIEGSEKGLKIAKLLLEKLDAQYFEIRTDAKKIYHLAAVLTSNFPVAFLYLARKLYRELGIDETLIRHILHSLLGSVASNVFEKELQEALTGPVKRGDWEVVEEEGKIFCEHFPEYATIYDTTVLVLKSLLDESRKDLER